MNREVEQIASYKRKFKWPVDTLRYCLSVAEKRYIRTTEDLLTDDELSQRIKESLTKLNVASKSVGFWKDISWVEMVFVTGSVASLNALAEHDIDLWIIVKPNRIWLTRFLEWIHFNKLGIRRNRASKEVKNLFCINYYKSVEDLRINIHSMAYAMQFVDAVPIFIRDKDIYIKLLTANEWIKEFFPSWYRNKIAQIQKYQKLTRTEQNTEKHLFWDSFNFMLGFIQQLKIKRSFPKIGDILINEFTTWQKQ